MISAELDSKYARLIVPRNELGSALSPQQTKKLGHAILTQEITMNEAAFRDQAKIEGYDEPEIVEKEANITNQEHTHDFAASALILAGQVSVVTAAGTTTCCVGDTFSLDGGIPHREEYGPEGARFLVARRTG